MNTYVADAALEETLSKLKEPTESRDVNGKTIGYFTPGAHETMRLYAEARARFDRDEMKRRKDSQERSLTTAEVLEHLRSLETS